MIEKNFFDNLEPETLSDRHFDQIFDTLRALRQAGVSREDVYQAVQSLRERTADEASEDRILEVMDIVSGFCNADLSVWDD